MTRKQRSIVSPPPPANPSGPSMLDSVKQGIGLGTGVEMARGLIGSIFPKEETTAYPFQDKNSINEECKTFMRSMTKCMSDDGVFCDEEINAYKKCIKEKS